MKDYSEEKKITIKNDRKEDVVNHPKHYEIGHYECINEMLKDLKKENVLGFCLGNAYKYLWRSAHKNGWEDLKKAKWYLNKYFEFLNDAKIINKTIYYIQGNVPLDLLVESQGLSSVIDYLRIEAFVRIKNGDVETANKLINTAMTLIKQEEEY